MLDDDEFDFPELTPPINPPGAAIPLVDEDDEWADVRLASEKRDPAPAFVPQNTGKAAGAATASDRTVFGGRHDGSTFSFDGVVTPTILDDLLLWASERKASDITIQTNERVMAVIGAGQWPITDRILRQPDIDMIVRYIYGDPGPGMIKAGHDLDPRHEVRMHGVGIMRYRVNMTGGRIPGGDGVQIKVRTLPKTPIRLTQLGVEQDIIDNIRPPDGLVFITGTTGSGKSTLLASMMQEILINPDSHATIVEYSQPVEYVYDGVPKPSSSIFQTEIGRHLIAHNARGTNPFAHAVRNALRRNPDIIIIGETRDEETMKATIEAALSGHALYSTLHVVGVPATLRRALQFYPPEYRSSAGVDIMEVMRVVISQVLVPAVDGSRVGLREYMVFDETTRYQFMRTPPDQWPHMARRLMMEKKVICKRLVDSAWEAYDHGFITREIYKRVVEKERSQQ